MEAENEKAKKLAELIESYEFRIKHLDSAIDYKDIEDRLEALGYISPLNICTGNPDDAKAIYEDVKKIIHKRIDHVKKEYSELVKRYNI